MTTRQLEEATIEEATTKIQRRSDITSNYDLLMTFQAKLLFVFADSAVAFTVLLLVSTFRGRPNPECM